MASRYQQGRETEYKAQRDLEAMGYQTVRAASSKGKADIVAFNQNATRFIQCKRYTDRPGSFTEEIAALMSLSLPPFASSELWLRQGGRVGWIERILIKSTHPTKMDVSDLDDLGREIKFTVPITDDRVAKLALRLANAAREQRWKDKQNSKAKKPSHPRSSTTSRTASKTRAASGMVAPPNEPAAATPASPADQPHPVDDREWC